MLPDSGNDRWNTDISKLQLILLFLNLFPVIIHRENFIESIITLEIVALSFFEKILLPFFRYYFN